MTELPNLLRARQESIIFEIIDKEVVLISLDTGTYYSLTDSGAVIFALLEGGQNCDGLLAKLNQLYDQDLVTYQATIIDFVQELINQSILTASALPSRLELDQEGIQSLIKKPFKVPVLEKFDDMQELFLLDPVRAVDAAGWSSQSQNNSNQSKPQSRAEDG